jgi:TPR repeat protein
MAARYGLSLAICTSLAAALTVCGAVAAPLNDAANPFVVKPPDPFKQNAIPLPPAASPKNASPASGDPVAAPVKLPQNIAQLTEDNAYAAYQRGYFIEAFALATELASKGDAQAMTMLGHLYSVGQGVRQDLPRAAQWYQLGADRGDREAQVALGLFYLAGTGVKQDKSKARDLFELAAKQNQPTALFNLAVLTIEGVVVHPDVALARDLMHRAAELGNAEAQYSYASMLDAANIPGREQEITYWMGAAARAGHVPAEVEYAIRLAKGKGAPADLDTAVLFLNRAAWSGNPIAQNRIAHLIAVGMGLPFDSIEAAKWHLIAKAGGVQDPQLEDLLASLKPEDLARARALAANWPYVPPDPRPTALQASGTDGPKFDLHGPLEVQHVQPGEPIDGNPVR